jgi:hypothetical protein
MTTVLIYKTNKRTSSTDNNKVLCLLPHVSVELRQFQGVNTPTFKTYYLICTATLMCYTLVSKLYNHCARQQNQLKNN